MERNSIKKRTLVEINMCRRQWLKSGLVLKRNEK